MLGSPVWAGFSPTHLFEVHWCSTFPPQSEWDVHPQLNLNDWLILAQSQDTLISHIDSLLIHLESLGLGVNMQKSIIAPSQSITYLGVCLDSVEMKARLSRESAAPFCLPCTILDKAALFSWRIFIGFSDSWRRLQRGVIWAYYTCARCSDGWNLESRGAVDFRMFEHRGHPRLHRSSDAVAQPRSLQPGSSPGLGSVARGGHDGRTDGRTNARTHRLTAREQ